MNWFLFVIAVIAVFIISSKLMKKVDERTDKALSTPGIASSIRENYPNFIGYIESIPNYQVEFERSDLIRYVNTIDRINKKIVVQNATGMIYVAFILDNVLLKQWNFKKSDITDNSMLESVKSYLQYKA